MKKRRTIRYLALLSASVMIAALAMSITACSPNDSGSPEPLAAVPFLDISEEDYYFDAVLWADQEGITNGTSETTFSPGQSCTRAQIVTFLWRAMSEPEVSDAVLPFVDVKEEGYYYQAVLWAYQNRITQGTDASHFSPDQTCTRGQIVTFLWRAMHEPECALTQIPFTDVKQGDYFCQPVLWAYERQITKGVSETAFGPKLDCTRGQVVTFLFRARELLQQALHPEPVPGTDPTGPDPDDPSEPDGEAPTSPSSPDQGTWIPDDPTGPTYPVAPDEPTEPPDPDSPGGPEEPSDPGSPGESEEPSEPDPSGGPTDPPGSSEPTSSTDPDQGTWIP